MTNNIHKSAIIGSKANLGNNVSVGPFSVIGDDVTLADNVIIHSHVVIEGNTIIGEGTEIFPFASIGHIPQDLKYHGENSSIEIGKNNIIREHVTINPGTEGGGMLTKIGNNCLFMVGSHVAHDCKLGNNIIMANNATLAGHVEIGDFAVIGGLAAIHQFVRVGHHAMIGGMSGIESDIIPYGQANGERANLVGLNLVGLKRRNFSKENINILRNVYKKLFLRDGTFSDRIKEIESEFRDNEEVMEIINFIQLNSSRAICQPKNDNTKDAA